MEAKFASCENCGKPDSYDCKLYLCEDENGFLIICCIVYVVNNFLYIVKALDGLLSDD